MGVSIDNYPHYDINAILQGGDELVARIAAFKAAKEAADQRLAEAAKAEIKAAATIDAAKMQVESIESAQAEAK